MILVGGVEGNLADLRVAPPIAIDGAHLQLKALEQGRLGGVAIALSVEDPQVFLPLPEGGAIAQPRHPGESIPAQRRWLGEGGGGHTYRMACDLGLTLSPPGSCNTRFYGDQLPEHDHILKFNKGS